MFDDRDRAIESRHATARWLKPAFLGLLFSGGAAAQVPPDTSASSPEAEAQAELIEAIVVTARRRAESLQDTPVAVTALSADALERQQIVSTTDLDKVAPNIQFRSYGTLTGNNSAAQVFIRGIGQTDATPAVDPGVGVYIDDVYMGRAVGAAMEFRDIANVQILRGPQGTLFGRNSIGGAVLLTTNQPGTDAGNSVRVGTGDDSLLEAFGAFDLPLSEAWSARIALGLRQRDGYVTRVSDGKDLGDEDMQTGQIALRWQPSDAFDLTLRGDYTKEDENGSPFVFREMNEGATFVGAASIAAGCPNILDPFPPPLLVGPLADPRCGNDAQALGEFTNGGTYPASSTLENSGVSLVANWKVNDTWSLKSITSDRSLEWTGTRDADNTPLLILHTNYVSESEQFSQELQAVVDGNRIDGVFGLYYFDEDSFDRLLVPLGNPGTSYDTQRVAMDTEAKAAFTEWTFKFTEAFSATAGVRYTEETKGLQATMFNVAPANAVEPAAPTALCPFAGPPPTQTGCLFLTTNRFAREFTSTTKSASAQYRFNESVMAYLSWSEGFKSGGFNQRYNNAPPGNAPISFGAETAESFEIGLKLDPLDTLRINLAAFSTDYDDIQMTYRLGVVPLLFNAGVASIDGGEIELQFAPTEDFRLDATVGYLDTQFESITQPPPFGPISPTATATLSSRLPFTPEWQGHLGMSYTFHPGSNWSLTPRVDLSYTAEQFFDAGNSPEIAQDEAITLINASVTLTSDDEKWRFMLGGTNLTDELYPVAGTSSLTTASGYSEIIYSRPLSWTLSVTRNF
ncbi:MAG TPA: TonB-dependent receptor [Steroidobacteraceae bacterium]|nr:TonB-dependent receptor [Steroidobacteraceae bacterium]